MRINRDVLYHVTDVLRDVARGDYPEDWSRILGLCGNVENLISDVEEEDTYDDILTLLSDGCLLWPDSTGNRSFPVPASPDVLHGQHRVPRDPVLAADDAYFYTDDLYIGTYGKSRRALAAWLADWMEQQA